MRRPQLAEEYIITVDNKGRERIQRVEYVVICTTSLLSRAAG